MHPTPFTDPTLRDAFFASLDLVGELPPTVALVGSGPFFRTDLARFLGTLDIEVVPASGRCPVMIAGREGWSGDTLGRVLDERSGRTLRVYSQEMFLAYAASGRDPFGQGREVVEGYGRGHPALQHLTTLGFDWPTTLVYQGTGAPAGEDGPDESPLRRLGYRLGRDAPAPGKRRQLLEVAFTSPLPQVGAPQYMEKWGQPGTARRLRRVASRVASLGRASWDGAGPAGRGSAEQAEDDLAWLEETYRREDFDFAWPSVRGA